MKSNPTKYLVLGPGIGDAFLELRQNSLVQASIGGQPCGDICIFCLTENDGVVDIAKSLPFPIAHIQDTYSFFKQYPGGPPSHWKGMRNISSMPRNNPLAYSIPKGDFSPKIGVYPEEGPAGEYVFINLFSTTPSKVVADPALVVKICKDLLNLHFIPVLQGKSTDLGIEAASRGYPPTLEEYPRIDGAFYVTGTPITNYGLIRWAEGCVLSESAYLQAATALKKPLFCFMGEGLQNGYEEKMKADDPFYSGLKYKSSWYSQVNADYEAKWQAFLAYLVENHHP